MRKIETVQKIILTCDQCWKVEEDTNTVWYSMETISSNWLRLYEVLWKRWYEVKHLVNRKEINFCCKDCVKTWLTKQMYDYVEEIAPITEKDRRETNSFGW